MSSKVPYTRKEAKNWAKETMIDWYDCPLTPMTKDFKIDEKGLRDNVEAYVEMGESALVLGGFLAECWNVTLSEWMRYHEVIAEANNGRLPLWTIILDPSVHQALEKLAFVEKLGFVGAEVLTPMVQLRTDEEIYDYFKYLSDRSNLALVFYRSAVTGKLISFDLSRKLSDLEMIVGMKQGSSNHGDSIKLRKMMRNDFVVTDPVETYWLDELRQGGQVIYGAFNHIVYGKKRNLLEEYTSLARAGKWEAAYQKRMELEPVRDLLDQVMFIPTFTTFTYATTLGMMKVWYEAIGLAAGPIRPPIRQVSQEKREWLINELKRVGVI